MSDANYRVVSIPRKGGALAERAAILRPLFPNQKLVKDADVSKAATDALELWRRRLNVLRQEGWSVVAKEKFQYARNCIPAAVEMRAETNRNKACCLATICPWCWARQMVKQTYDRVSTVMAAHDSVWVRDRVTPYPYKLLVATRHVEVSDSDVQPVASLDRVCLQMEQKKSLLASRLIGAMYLATVYPSKKNWKMSERVIGLAPQDLVTREDTKVVTNPTKRNIAAAVARFARYPSGMMFGDPKMTIRVLDARPRYRLYRTAGVFFTRQPPRDPDGEGDTRNLDL